MTPQRHACTSAPRGRSARDLRTLFSRCSAGDARAREAIIVGFLPYARQLARRYRGRGELVEDLYQVASVGLIKAVDRYEPRSVGHNPERTPFWPVSGDQIISGDGSDGRRTALRASIMRLSITDPSS